MANIKSGYVTKTSKNGRAYREEGKGGFNQFLHTSDDSRKILKHFMDRTLDVNKDWRGLIATPPGSILHRIITPYRRHTDVPLELPLFAGLHYVATYLSARGVYIKSNKIPKIKPFLWNVILAPSGAGKTLSHDWIGKHAPAPSNMVNCESSAKFFEELKRCKEEDGYASWFCDEFAQKLKAIETLNSPLAEVKQIALKAYNGGKIDRSTKKTGTLVIEDPTFNFYGVNTEASFIDSISVESMLDGFAQRFGYIYTVLDPDRHITDFAIYNEEIVSSELEGAFNDLLNLELHESYFLTDDAEAEYTKIFKDLFQEGAIPNSFYRRTLFKTLTYALLYHVINLKTSQNIDAEDVQWASRVTELHLSDIQRILNEKGLGEFKEKVEQVKAQKQRYEDKGKDFKARDVVHNNKSVSNTSEAVEILKYVD